MLVYRKRKFYANGRKGTVIAFMVERFLRIVASFEGFIIIFWGIAWNMYGFAVCRFVEKRFKKQIFLGKT